MCLRLCRGLRTGEQAKTVQMLRDEGVTVEVSTLDVALRGEAQQLLALCEALAPLGGIFHLAMVLEDRLIAKHVCSTVTGTNLGMCNVHLTAL